MNDLCQKYGDKLVILAFPTNQFGHQENSNGEEILNTLKHVRPGNGFEPKCILFQKGISTITYFFVATLFFVVVVVIIKFQCIPLPLP